MAWLIAASRTPPLVGLTYGREIESAEISHWIGVPYWATDSFAAASCGESSRPAASWGSTRSRRARLLAPAGDLTGRVDGQQADVPKQSSGALPLTELVGSSVTVPFRMFRMPPPTSEPAFPVMVVPVRLTVPPRL